MVSIEALACGTPVIGLNCGATPEIVGDGTNGLIVAKDDSEAKTVAELARAIKGSASINRADCRASFEERFTLDKMCREHLAVYSLLSG